MAENKKGFILYADLIHTIEKMPIEKAGELFMHILNYVNDKNPVSKDLIINLTFEPIKQQLKRDLNHWESVRLKRSGAGIASANKRKQMSTHVESVEQTSTNPTVIVNDNVKVNVNVNIIIDYLNKVCGTNYKKGIDKTIKLITARLNENFTIDDFKIVIDNKFNEWNVDAKMKTYLRPETLFGTKFESYLQSTKPKEVPYEKMSFEKRLEYNMINNSKK